MAKKRIANKHVLFHGKEPIWAKPVSKEDYDSALSESLNYYSTIPLKDKKKYFVKWAKDQGKTTEQLSGIPTDYLTTISSQARMIQQGFVFNKKHTKDMLDKLNKLISDYPPVVKVIDPNVEMMKTFAKEQAIEAMIGNVLGQFDVVIDAQLTEKKQLKSPVVDCSKLNVGQKQELVDYYTNQLLEFKLVYNKADPDLVDGYKGVPRVQISRMMKLHVNILDEIQKQQLLAQAKKPRKARSKKVKTSKELTKSVKYLTSHKEYGIMSIDVSKLIGCSEVYIFNTKNRKLQYYYSDSGITVKGTTLQNFQKGTSIQKTIRKPKEFLADLLKQPKVRSKKLFTGVNAKGSKLTGRINEHCIILKVY